MKNYSTEALIAELETRGYLVDNCWSINDVQSFRDTMKEDFNKELDMSSNEILEVMRGSISGECITEIIRNDIYNTLLNNI